MEGLESRTLLAGDLIVRSLSDLQFDQVLNQYSYDAGQRSSVTFASDLATHGASLSITADEIYVEQGISVDTSSTVGKAGDIVFDTHTKVYLWDNAKLLANGIDDSHDGAITITASHDMQTRAYVTAINMVENLINALTSPAEITILSGVTIDGGNVTLQTENGNHKMEAGSAYLDQFKKAWKVYAAASPLPSSILSLPVTFQDWRPKARISINQSNDPTLTSTKILGSNSVVIDADAHASAVGKAVSGSILQWVWNQKNPDSEYGWFGQKKLGIAWSIGWFLTDPEATIDIGNTTVSSDGDISISTEVKNSISLTAKSTMNTGAGKTNPAGKAISLAWSEQSTTSTIYVDRNSLISSEGAVSITAEATNTSSTTSSSAVYRDGTVGLSPAVANNETHVTVTIDGQVTAFETSPNTPVPPPPFETTFNPTFAVDVPASKVTLSGDAIYKTGDAIALFSEEGGTIPGLPEGLYYLIVTPKSNSTYELQFAASYEDALALKFISFGDAYPSLTNTRTNLKIPVTQTATDIEQRSLIMFSDANGPDGATPLFEEGDSVQFAPAAKRFLGYIPTSGQLVDLDPQSTYRVRIVESESETYPLAIQLLDGSNTPLNLFGGSYLRSESGVRYPIGAIALDQGQIDLRIQTLDATGESITRTPPAIPIFNGQQFTFHAGLTDASDTLHDGESFWAIVDPNNPGVIRLAVSPSQAEAANPSVQEAVAHLTAVVQGQQVHIPIDNFESGVGLVFSENPNLLDNQPVTYHEVPGKPMPGLVDGGVYYVYNVPNTNYNPVVPQYILTLMNGVEISSDADAGSFELKITALDGSSATTSPLAWNISAEELQTHINGLGLDAVNVTVSGVGTIDAPWFIDGVNVDSVELRNSSLTRSGVTTHAYLRQASPQVLMDSTATDGTFALEVTGNDGSQKKTGELAWNITAEQLQGAINGLALGGVTVRVEGSGTSEDPWLIHELKPSQVAVDSTKLRMDTESTTMQMTSARQVQFYNGQSMDDLTGTQYPITGSDRDNGTLTLNLPDNAPVVSADNSQLVGDGTGIPGVTFESIPESAFEIFSIATSGTFTLTFTDSFGDQHTSTDLDFDATPSELAAAIAAITGAPVSVTGRGSIGSPWMVFGPDVDQITSESKLVNALGEPTDLVAQTGIGEGYRLWVEYAQGGTFRLTLDNTKENVTTTPISFNATATDVVSALRALPAVTAQVTGAGTSDDPWILQTGALPIQTGDPLVFRDSWGMSGLGMIDSRTYYAIVLDAGIDPREITLQLAATREAANGASTDWANIATNQHIEMRPYLPLKPTAVPEFIGKSVTLYGVPSDAPDGITISANLNSSNSIGSYANLGGFPLLSYAPGVNQFATKKLNNNNANADGTDSWIENLIKNRIPDGKDIENQREFVGSAALQWIDNSVEVIIGRTAEIGTDGTLIIQSDINQTLSTESNAGLSKTNSNNENWAVAGALALSNVSNTSRAIVSSNAIITGGYGVDIDSNISYVPPAHWPVIRQVGNAFSKDHQFWKHILGEVETVYSDLFLGDLGLLAANFNTIANVGIARVGDTDNSRQVMSWVVTGSFAYEIIHNENLAQIADGAKVNVPNQPFTIYDRPTEALLTRTANLKPKWTGYNEQQTVGFTADQIPSDARFKLSYDYLSTDWLDADATASEVQAALEELKLIGTGNVTVTTDPNKSHEWKLTFIKDLANKNVDQVTIQTQRVNNVSLTMDSTSENILPAYGVSVVAETNTQQWGLAGQLYFSIPYMIHGFFTGEGSGVGKAWREGGPFQSASKNAFGGSQSLLTMDGKTQALLGGYDAFNVPDDPTTEPFPQSTEVHYGTGYEGGLEIYANTTNGIVQVAQAAANSSGWGIEGSVAYVAMGEPHATVKPDDRRQITYAKMISRTVPLHVYPIGLDSDGDISVVAHDQSSGWAITGSIMIGQSKGIGLSGSVIELTRDVQASIGSQYNHQQDDTTKYTMDPYRTGAESTQQSGSEINTNGFLTVNSHVGGTIVPLSLVGSGAVRSRGGAANLGYRSGLSSNGGSVGSLSEIELTERELEALYSADSGFYRRLDDLKSKSSENDDVPAKENELVPADGSEGDSEVIENGQNSKEGKWGFFVSGDFAAAFVTDQVYGYINLDGNVIGNGLTPPDDKKTISSGNSTTVNPSAGSFALQWDKSNDRGETKDSTSGFAGSVAWASVQSDVQAVIDGTTVDNMAVKLAAENNKKVGSGAAGLQLDSPTGFDLQVAGSVVINSISNTTVASLRNSNLTDMVDLDIKAYAKDHIYGLAGTVQVSLALFEGGTVVGFGMSAVWNDINSTTTAEIVDCPTITQILGETQVIAEDFTTSIANSFGVQLAVTNGTVVEIGGMWTTNLLFPNTTAQITGSNVENTNPNPGTTMLVSATLAPILESFAGYFAIGWSNSEASGQVGAGAAVITTRIGNKKEELDDPNDNYQTLAQISHSTIEAYDSVDVYALTGDLNEDTLSYVPDQSESELSDSSVDRYNIRSLAIAGGAQAGFAARSVSAQGSFVSTKTRIATLAQVTDSTSILQASGHASDLTVKAINQITAHTDSGGVSAGITFSGTVGIAFGGAVNQYNSFNSTEALVDGSTVNARNTIVSATLAPFIENIAFGVAISASASVAVGDSGADVHLNQYDSAHVGVSNSNVTTNADLQLKAVDDSFLKTSSGSGTLSIGVGAAGLAFGEVFNIVRVRNDVLAWVGTKPTANRASRSDDKDETPIPNIYATGALDSSTITVGGCLTIEALSGQTIQNTTTAVAVTGSGTFALAGSGADAKVHLANIVRAGINDVANVTVIGLGDSHSKPGVTVRAEILPVNSADSVKDRMVNLTVGDVAGAVGSYGASIGLSFGQITNDDLVVAQIENSTVTVGSESSGSAIDLSASDNRYMESNVWVTSIAIAIGGAGAGGHSFIYSQPIVIAEVGHGSRVIPNNDSHRSDLSVMATGQESAHAGIFGGVAGLAAIGDFIAETDKHGIVGAVLGTVGTLNVNTLTVEALGNHNLDAHGWSLGGGALAISGDGHKLTYDEQIVAWAGGDVRVLNSKASLVAPTGTTTTDAASDVTLKASSSTKASSSASAKPDDDNHSGNWAVAALGFFHSHADYIPTISVETTNFQLTYGGDLQLIAQSDKGLSYSRAVTTSASIDGVDTTKAHNTIKPNTTLTIADTTLASKSNSSGTMSLRATNDMHYDTYAFTFAITYAIGGSGSRVFNDFQPIAEISFHGNNEITSAGAVDVVTHNAWARVPDSSDGQAQLFNDSEIANSSQGLGGGTLAFDASTVGGTTDNQDAEIVQYVGFDAGDTGDISGGTFRLSYAGQTTAALDYNAKASEVQSALENLLFPNLKESNGSSFNYLLGKVDVDRIDSSKHKMQWKITFSEGLGTQQVTIDPAKVTHTGNLIPIQSTDPLPWSYDGASIIDFGTSTTEVKASDSTKPIDVTWLATQSIDIKEYASQKTNGTSGKAYAKSTVALNLNNHISLDQAHVTLDSGIDHFTIASAVEIDALSQAGVHHPLLGGGESDAVIVVNSTSTYEDSINTAIKSNAINIIAGGQAGDWNTIHHPMDSGFTPQISTTAQAGTTGDHYVTNAVVNHSNTITQRSSVRIIGDSSSQANLIVTDEDTAGSHAFYAKNNSTEWQKTDPIVFTNSHGQLTGTIQLGQASFDLWVHDEGISVNGKQFDWNVIDPANSVQYQDVVSSPGDSPGNLYRPFVAGKSQSVEAALGEIMDPESLNSFKQNYTIPQTELAYILQQIEVPQPSMRIVADRIQGTGTVSTQVPQLNIENKTFGWLILNGIGSQSNRHAGTVTLLDSKGNPGAAPGLTIQSSPEPEKKIDVSVSPPASSDAKPFMIIAGYLNAPSSEVTLTNNYGPIIELAPIRAASVTINVPNSAFVVYTPDDYQGTGGNSMLAFENAAYANALDTSSSSNPSANLPFLPGQTTNGIDANYIAPAAADYVYGTHSSKIPLDASGPTHIISSQLGQGITAAQIAIFAKTIDINAPLKVGKIEDLSVTLSSALGDQLRNFKSDYELGTTTSPVYTIQDISGDSSDVTATYDARTNQITLSSISLSQSIRVILDGQIISTVDGSMVQLIGGPGGVTEVLNQTGIPLILSNIDAGDASITGSVEFRDTATQINTQYVYNSAEGGISIFTAPREQSYAAIPDQTLNSQSIDYQPQPNTLYVSEQRQDIFKASTKSSVFAHGNPNWYPLSSWNFGEVFKSGFGEFRTVNVASTTSDQKQLTLTTNGTGGAANAAWLEQPIDVTRSFMVSFRYEGSGDGDGIAFALQAAGTHAVGTGGGGLGYAGIAGHKAAFMINLYDYKDGPHPGVNFDSNEDWGRSYQSSSPVSVNSPMEVQLYYDAVQHIWFAFLSDSSSSVQQVFQTNIDLATKFGSASVFAGFTGSTGLKSSTQTVKNFLLVYDPQTVPAIDYLDSDLVTVAAPQLSSFNGFSPAGYLTADAISADAITFTNDDTFSNRQRAAWYDQRISTDVDSLSVDFTYQASFQNPKIEGFEEFAAQNSSYASAITADTITLTSGAANVARAAWFDGEIDTRDDFEINFRYQTDGKAIQGFSNFTAPRSAANAASITPNQVTLTNGATSITRAAWHQERVPVNYGFTIDFTYQAGGDKDADGIALVFQTQGTNAVGNGGASLGYVGIAGRKAAYQINIFGGDKQTKGSNFVTDNTSGSYNKTGGIGGVDFSDGDPVRVRLTYDPASKQLFESLTNLHNNNTYTHTYSNIDLASVLGTSQAYIGFTGSSGGKTAVQTVKDFAFQSNQADGIALVFQTQGTGAIGYSGSGLGYVGIPGHKAAYQINLFAGDSHTIGSNFVTSDFSGRYSSTGDVNFASGHPIHVQLSYNNRAQQVTEKLTDLISNTTYTRIYSNINLSGLLGSSAFVGFTGSSGAVTSMQSVQDFSMEFFPDDGIALVFQSAGTEASGGAEDGLGYVGIPGPTAAYQINLKSNGLQGSNFVTTNTAGTYLSTGNVDFASRNPIHVQLNYNNAQRQLKESLTDTVTGATFSRVYHGIDLASVLGPTTYVGFTAPHGSDQGIQTVQGFSLGGTSTETGFKQHFSASPLSISSDNSTTSYATNFSTWVRADHPIRVDFSGISTSNDLNINSNASLMLNGLIRVANTASLTATSGSVTSTSMGLITARTVSIATTGDDGFIGTLSNPVTVSQTKTGIQSGFVSASGISGVYLASPGDLSIGYVSTVSPTDSHDGPVVINASGDIVPHSSTSLIFAGNLSMTSGGSIGSIANPLPVQLVPNVVLGGSTVAGLLNAQADGDISLYHFGDVRVDKVKSPGTVAITTHDGNILDGLTLDALGLNDPTLSPQTRRNIHGFLTFAEPDLSDEWINSLEASVNAQYMQYWQLIPVLNFPVQPPLWNTWDPGDWGAIVTITDSDGNPQQVYQLTAEGIEAFRPKAALDYQKDNPSDTEVQDYVNQIWQSCISTFADPQAFGPNWESLPQFQQYDPTYQFVASDETVATIKASYQESFNLFSYLSSEALANPAVATAIAKLANIEAGNLILTSSGSIGEDRAAVDIPLEHFENDTLTDAERQAVRFASQAGEIQLIGKNASGETIYYDASSPPDSVTLTGVRIKISRPLLVQLAANGSLTATSGSELLVVNTSGDLNIKSANSTSKGFVWLESAESLLVADGTTGTTVTGGSIRLGAGQAIGTSAEPLIVSASGKVDLASLADASLKSSSPLEIGQWNVAGALNLIVDGSGAVTDALASNRNSFAGFGGNEAGWTADTTHGSAAVTSTATDDVLNVALDAGGSSSSTWPSQVVFAKNDPVHLSNHFALGFLYQSSAVGSRVALNLGNTDQQGLALVLNLGGADGTDAWADFVTTSEITTATGGQSIGSVLLNSDHPIQVTITYSMLTQTVVASLIDTVTKQAIAIEKTGVNLTQRLGSAAATIDWTVLGDGATSNTHSIRGFRLIDGSANFVANTLNVVVGSAFGTVANSSTNQPENPILLLIDGKTQITAGGAIVAEQVVGDLEVGVISSPTTIEVSAPFGMIVQASNDGSGGEGETTLQGVVGPNVSIGALLGIGTADGKLMVTTDHLSATTSMNDLELQHQSHAENSVAEIANLIAGGTVRLRTNSDVSVTGRVIGQSAEFHSYYPGKAVRLALKDLEHLLGGSLGIVLSGFESLHLDDTQASEAHEIEVGSGIVESHTAKITTGVVRELAMSLGLGDDRVSVLDASGLSALSIDGQDGHDSVSLANAALAISQVHLNGGLGDDELDVDLRNTGTWVTKGKLETASGMIQHQNLAKFILNRLEEPGHPEAIEKIEQIAEAFPEDRLMVVGTTGMDSLAMHSLASGILVQANWNAQSSERRTYSKSAIREVQLYLLGADDFLSVIGTGPIALDVHSGMGNDWVFVQSLSATITDTHGDNVITTGLGDDVIHTGTGNDEIDAGPGENQIRDEGGLNTITTGDGDDKIWHANAEDWIIAHEGVNDIWLQGVHQDWHNENSPMDVTRNGEVNFLDTLVLINKINRTGPGVLQGSADSVQFLYDVTGDNHITPLDVLRIINWINRNQTGEGESLSEEVNPRIDSQFDGVVLGQRSGAADSFSALLASSRLIMSSRELEFRSEEPHSGKIDHPSMVESDVRYDFFEAEDEIELFSIPTASNSRILDPESHDAVFSELNDQDWDEFPMVVET